MTLRLDKDGKIARLVIDRPDKRNAFNQDMWDFFPTLLADAMADDAVRVLMVHASERGSAFCAGADIAEFGAGAQDPTWRATNQASINKLQHELARAPKPTIAIVDGDCVGGGCGIAMACDFRIAGPAARFGITPAKLGLVYPLHDTKLLVDLVGSSQAKRLLYTAALISAAEAEKIGLVTMLADQPYDAAMELATHMAEASGQSQMLSKMQIQRILDGQAHDDAETLAEFRAAFDSADFKEGVSAFLSKRKPEFK
ncbi:CaiD Enoyl-CoA hydratase/carnithine racemase [Sphingomonadaceae bacterium]|jgi:enoyl-CoA hydratase/carnithine racemase|uniref:enoyl-CoA hydratase/isomerase family protein n=1 Tax=Sphingorhabdus sp. TaxID=1902408 RepID=UPI002FDCB7BE|nr:enoyl-CoA hydratase/isomerase family protein [Sphingomonadaceae bacterium]